MTLALLVFALSVLTAGGVACAFARGKGASYWGAAISLAGAAAAIWPASVVLYTGRTLALRVAWQIPFGSFSIAVDPLSALFILVISVVSALAAVYGVGLHESRWGTQATGPGVVLLQPAVRQHATHRHGPQRRPVPDGLGGHVP